MDEPNVGRADERGSRHEAPERGAPERAAGEEAGGREPLRGESGQAVPGSGAGGGPAGEGKDSDRVKTAREILEEKLARMRTESLRPEEALRAAADREGGGAASGAPAAAPARPDLASRIAAVEKERDDFKNEALRARADLDNYQKRIRREMDEVRTYAAAGVLAEVIEVLDNLDLALAAAAAKPDVATLVEGVEMVRGQLEKILTGRGAERIAAAGVPFDPRRHHAVVVEERDDVPDGTATSEFRRGYALKDRVLRAADVKVSRAPAGAKREVEREAEGAEEGS